MRSLLLVSAAVTLLAAPVHAQSGNAAARASGELVGGSVEVGSTAGSAGVAVVAGTAVLVTGSATFLTTGDERVLEESEALAEAILEAPFGSQPLVVDEEIVAPAPAPAPPPDVPYSPES